MTWRYASDRSLIESVGRGDATALAEVHERHGAAVRAAVRRLLGDRAMADDVEQEVFVNLWFNPARFDHDRGTLRTYLVALARNRSIDFLRSEGARRAREDRTECELPPDIELQVVDTILHAQVVDAVRALPDRERTAIMLAYFGGRSYREAAMDLGLPEGTVKCRIRTGLRRLQGSLGAVVSGDEVAASA